MTRRVLVGELEESDLLIISSPLEHTVLCIVQHCSLLYTVQRNSHKRKNFGLCFHKNLKKYQLPPDIANSRVSYKTSVHHSSLKHIPFCRRSSQVSSYDKTVIIYFVIIQIPRGNGRTVERQGCIAFRNRILQQRSTLSYKVLTYYLQVKNATLIRKLCP